MSNRPQLLIAVEEQLRIAERFLIKQRGDIREFVQTEHTAKDALEQQVLVTKTENKLAALLDALLENRDVSIEFRVQANDLCDRCRALNEYTRDMYNALSVDLIERRRVEDKKSAKDIAKDVTFFFGIPIGLAGAVKNGLGGDHITIEQAAGAGFAISTTVIFRKRILKIIKSGIGSVRKSPKLINRATKAVYYSPVLMDCRIGTNLAFRAGADP